MNVWVELSSIRIGILTTSDRFGNESRSRMPGSRSITPATVRNCLTAIWKVGESLKRVTGGCLAGLVATAGTEDDMRKHLATGERKDRTEGTTPLYPTALRGRPPRNPRPVGRRITLPRGHFFTAGRARACGPVTP